jgi:hypothetical protein
MSQSTEVKLSRRYRLDKMKNQIANEIEQITKQGLQCESLFGKVIPWTKIVEILRDSGA